MWKAVFIGLLFVTAAMGQEVKFKEGRFQRVMLVEATVNGRAATLIVDTGADLTILTPEAAGMSPLDLSLARFNPGGAGFRGEAIERDAVVNLGSSRDVRVKVAVMRLESVSKIYGVKVDGLIGLDLLRRYGKVTIDYKNKKIVLGE